MRHNTGDPDRVYQCQQINPALIIAAETTKQLVEDEDEEESLYSWVSVFVSFCILLMVDGFIQCYGNFLEDLMVSLDTSAFNVMLCGVLFNGVSCGCGPLSAALINKFGTKPILVAGTLLSSSMIILSFFIHKIWLFNILLGGFGGAGFSCMLLTAYTLPSLWFHRKRALVSGISLAGSGACYILYSPLIDSLIEQYTARGALLILGAVNLHNLALAALIWTWKSPKTQAMASKGKLGPSRDLDADARDLKIIRSPKKSCSLLKKIWNLSRSIFSGHLFRSPHFYQIIFSAMCYCLVGFSMPQIFKDYSRTLEIPKAMSSMLLSIMGVSIVILKISVGVFANYIRRPLIIYLAGGCVLAAVTSLLPIVPALYYAYTTLYSCGSSLYLSMQTSVIATILGPENITSTMGYIFFVQGITLLTVVPAFLQLNVLTGTYTMTLLLLGMITAVGVVVMVPFLCQRHFR